MKKLTIEIITQDDKVATAIRTIGYSNENMSDQLEILGIIENTKGIVNEIIKKLLDVSK